MDINVCEEILRDMRNLEFNESSIELIKRDPRFIEAYSKENVLQKTMLTMVFYNVLMNGNSVVPSQIRLGLNIATSVEGWLEDMKLVVLPFLKVNEDVFFKIVH